MDFELCILDFGFLFYSVVMLGTWKGKRIYVILHSCTLVHYVGYVDPDCVKPREERESIGLG